MIFQEPVEFINPFPIFKKGVIIIQSDDANDGTYHHWLKRIKKLNKKNQWLTPNMITVGVAVNSGTIGSSGKMSISQLQECYNDFDWEMLSHGKWHTGLNTHIIVATAESGQNRVDISLSAMLMNDNPYTYRIWDNTNSEEVTILSRHSPEVNPAYSNGYVLLNEELQHTYNINAKFQITPESAHDLLNDCKTEMEAWGLTVDGHVYTFHGGSQFGANPEAIESVSNLFESGRGDGGYSNDSSSSIYNLKCGLFGNLSNQEIDTLLDDTATNDYVTIVYGHGEQGYVDKLEYLILGALNRGIRILTMTEALDYL